MSSGLGSKGKKESSTRVDIPAFLQPFLRQGASTAGRALTDLERGTGGDLVANFTPEQQEAFRLASERATGGGGFIPIAQQQLLDTAQGVPLDQFLPESALNTLNGFGQDISQFLPPDVLAMLSGGGSLPGSSVDTLTAAQNGGLPAGSEFLSQIGGQDLLPGQDTISQLTQGTDLQPIGTDEFGRALSGDVIPAETRDALSSTARGDFLFGGQGFDEAVAAATRAARPQILSTFGRAGAGGSTSGLAQTAVGQSAIDAFARQFGQERSRQLSAADRLAGLDLAAQGQRLDAQGRLAGVELSENEQALANSGLRLDAANTLGGLSLAGRGQGIDAAGLLGGLDLSNRGLEVGAAESLANLGLLDRDQDIRSGGLLASLAGDERGRALSSAGLLSGLSADERDRQLNAVGQLPDAGLLDVNLLQQIGEQRQGQAQREIDAPLQAQLQLLVAALGGLPISGLLGQSGTERNRGFSLGFGG